MSNPRHLKISAPENLSSPRNNFQTTQNWPNGFALDHCTPYSQALYLVENIQTALLRVPGSSNQYPARNRRGEGLRTRKDRKKMTQTTPDHYEILNLPFPPLTNKGTGYTNQQFKVAYHKALLKHHPDKAPSAAAVARESQSIPSLPESTNTSASTSTNNGKRITIDAITTAYKTLSDPALRAEYDRVLRLDRSRIGGGGRGKGDAVFHTGLEVVDLEDLDCDEGAGEQGMDVWYRGCRCGDERGFLVSEGDLEREAENGEVVVGCRGCSLYMKVLFAVQDGKEEDGEGDQNEVDGHKT